MALNYGDVISHPLFIDALSGEFSPATDLDRRHTLARLAIATCVKGQQVEDRSMAGSNIAVAYSPSWAPDVRATVSGELMLDGHFFLSSIGLEHKSGEPLDVTDDTNEEDMAVTILAGEDDLRTYQIELGGKLAVAREAVTAAVTDFFER